MYLGLNCLLNVLFIKYFIENITILGRQLARKIHKQEFNIKENASWMIGQKIYSMILSLIVGSFSAKYLGPSNYGLLNYGISVIAFSLSIVSLGLDNILVSEMIKRPDKQGDYLGTSIILRCIVAFIAQILSCVIVCVLNNYNSFLLLIVFIQSTVLLLNVSEILVFWFQMKLKMRYVSLAACIGITISSVWRCFLLVKGASVLFFSIAPSIEAFVTGLIVFICYLKLKAPKLRLNMKVIFPLLKISYHYIISGIAIDVYMHIDRIMLKRWVDLDAVGYYSAAVLVVELWEFIPIALVNSLRPVIIEKKVNENNDYLLIFKRLLFAINFLGFFVCIFILLFGRIIIKILYGEAYYESVPIMNILVWSTCFAIIGVARTIWIVCEGKDRYTKYYIFIGAFINIALNFIFIPLWGTTGAAITTLISQFVVALIAPLLFKETREFIFIFFDSFKQIKNIHRIIYSISRK